MSIQKDLDDHKTRIETEIMDERKQGLATIDEEGKKIREAKLKNLEGKLHDMKKQGIGKNEEEFGDLLARYGDHVATVDDEMKAWKQEQMASLEERLR